MILLPTGVLDAQAARSGIAGERASLPSLARRADHQEHFLEARIEQGQPGQIGEMLPVSIHGEMRAGTPFHGGAGERQPPLELRRRRFRRRGGLAQLRPGDLDQAV